MIADKNGIDYAICSYGSVMYFFMEAYGVHEESKKFSKLQEKITELLDNAGINYTEHELEIAIVVFIFIESQVSKTELDDSLKIFSEVLQRCNITTAIQLERFFCLDESLEYKNFVQKIKSRKIDLNFDFTNIRLTMKNDTIIFQQGGKQLTIES